jgi:hypothetical protein
LWNRERQQAREWQAPVDPQRRAGSLLCVPRCGQSKPTMAAAWGQWAVHFPSLGSFPIPQTPFCLAAKVADWLLPRALSPSHYRLSDTLNDAVRTGRERAQQPSRDNRRERVPTPIASLKHRPTLSTCLLCPLSVHLSLPTHTHTHTHTHPNYPKSNARKIRCCAGPSFRPCSWRALGSAGISWPRQASRAAAGVATHPAISSLPQFLFPS